MNDSENTITIPLKEYNQLIKDQEFLQALQTVGVDNWEGYGEAWKMMRENDE